jgi:RecA/RadA recombinase
MAKKDKDIQVDDSLDLQSIIKGLDGIDPLVTSEVLTTRKRIRSKVEILNCLLGGGRPYGSVTGSFGPPAGGKSTEAYESAAEFLKQEPDGIVVIIDQEASADPNRLEFLGVTPERVLRVKSDSINTGFDRLLDLLKVIEQKQVVTKKRIPIFVVWDTISKGKAEDEEVASRMDARNRARVIKSRMNDLNPWLDKVDIILVLLNQVILGTDSYGNATVAAGGGVGLTLAF